MLALAIPILGINPVKGQLLTQVFNVFVLPLVIVAIIILINRRDLMENEVAGYFLNTLLGLAFLFSVIISYNGILALSAQFSG